MSKPIYLRPNNETWDLFCKAVRLLSPIERSKNKVGLRFIREMSKKTINRFERNKHLTTD